MVIQFHIRQFNQKLRLVVRLRLLMYQDLGTEEPLNRNQKNHN